MDNNLTKILMKRLRELSREAGEIRQALAVLWRHESDDPTDLDDPSMGIEGPYRLELTGWTLSRAAMELAIQDCGYTAAYARHVVERVTKIGSDLLYLTDDQYDLLIDAGAILEMMY